VPLSDSRPIRFVHRGAAVEVSDVPTTKSVLYWLREDAHAVGTKEGCNEGDCGACMVVFAERDDDAIDGVSLRPVNACLQPLAALDGCALLTIEDLKRVDPAGTPHPAQRAMVACHGSQCGFCTPGFTMSLAACYDDHVACGTRADRQEIADALSGNLCRCTGYRPILDAGSAMFDEPAARIDRRALRRALDGIANDAPLVHRGPQYAQAALAQREDAWIAAPRTIDDLATLYAEHPDAKLVAGATDVGIWITQQFRDLPKLIRTGSIDELKRVLSDIDYLTIGAGASLEMAWGALVDFFPTLREMQLRFASLPLRLAGTMGGNVANGSPIGDSAPVLLALDATLRLRRGDDRRTLALNDFYVDYMKNRLEQGEFIEAIVVPMTGRANVVRAYKLSKRYDCDISALSAGLALRIEQGLVAHVRFAFGGMAATCKRATRAEAAVMGQPWSRESVDRMTAALDEDFAPLSDMRASRDYRLRAAKNLLMRFWLETREDDPLDRSATTVWPQRLRAEA
jgi:xanthine dehydrogenase small subunit